MITCPSFVLARVADREAPTFELVPYTCEPGCCAPAGWVGSRCLICNDGPVYGGTVEAITDVCREHEERVHDRVAVLAWCEMVRAIVALAQRVSLDETRTVTQSANELARSEALDDVVCLLAAMFHTHPDYDPAWAVWGG